MVEVILEAWRRRDSIRRLKLTYRAPLLRHLTARFAKKEPRRSAKLYFHHLMSLSASERGEWIVTPRTVYPYKAPK